MTDTNRKDTLIRGTAFEGRVRAFAVRTTATLNELKERHDLWPTATAAFGRALSASVMMAAMLKDEEKLTVQIKGNGPIGQMVFDANTKGDVRGYVDNPHVDLEANGQGKFDVAGAVGTEGMMYVIKDLNLKEPYRGSSPIVSGELGEDFTYYFAQSEQTPSVVALGVLINPDTSVREAGGFIVQLLPGVADEEIDEIEASLSGLRSMTEMLDQGLSLEQIVQNVLPTFEQRSEHPVQFRCTCSRERVEQVLISMGKDEIETVRKEIGKAEVSCQFCNESYVFDEDDLVKLL